MVAVSLLHKENTHSTVLSEEHTSHAWEPDYDGLINPQGARTGFSQCKLTWVLVFQLIQSEVVGWRWDVITNPNIFTQMFFLALHTAGLHLHLVTKSQLSQANFVRNRRPGYCKRERKWMKIKWGEKGSRGRISSCNRLRTAGLCSGSGYFLIRLACLSNQIFCSPVIPLIRLFAHVQLQGPSSRKMIQRNGQQSHFSVQQCLLGSFQLGPL